MAELLYIIGSRSQVLRKFSPANDYLRIIFCDREKKSNVSSANFIPYDLLDGNSNDSIIEHVASHSADVCMLYAAYLPCCMSEKASLFDVNKAIVANCIMPVDLFSRLSQRYPDRRVTGVFISSIYARVSPNHKNYKSRSTQNPLYYGVCKAGVEQGLKWLSSQNPNHRFNSIVLGPMPSAEAIESDPRLIDRLIESMPSSAMVRSEELAKVINFLLNTDLLSLRGSAVVLDGGYTLW